MLIQDLLELSPLRLVTALPETTIGEVARRMAKFNVGFLVIIDNEEIVGVLSERDIVMAIGHNEIDLDVDVVGDFMTETVVAVSPADSIVDAVVAMNTNGIRHLVATDGKKPVGVLSIRDVLQVFARQVLDENQGADEQLTMDFVKALAA